jgi:hypothetical protein
VAIRCSVFAIGATAGALLIIAGGHGNLGASAARSASQEAETSTLSHLTPSSGSFTCSTPTIFLAQSNPTQLFGGVLGAGKIAFTAIGKPSTWSYNAIGFDSKSGYLYGVSIPESSKYPAGHLLQIGSSGAVTDLGSISGDPNLQKVGADNGAFDGAGNFWVARTGYPEMDEVSLTSKPPKVVKTVKFAPSSPGLLTDDFTYGAGYMWGMAANGDAVVIQRLSLTTGAISTYPAPKAVPVSTAYGAAWTFGNGDLGFQSNQTGQIFEVAVADPSTTPSFSLLSLYSGPSSPGNNDGAACALHEVDLGMTISGPTSVVPDTTVTWTETVTNHGPGISSGYVTEDTLPTGFTDPSTNQPESVCSIPSSPPYTIRCSEGLLAVGAKRTLTISATAPQVALATYSDTATVTGNEFDPNPNNNSSTLVTKTTIGKPTVTTAASASGAVGGTFYDSLTITEGAAPIGTINLAAYPAGSGCEGSPIVTTTASAGGDGTVKSIPVAIDTAGTYDWVASYPASADNDSFGPTPCGTAAEQFTVGKASPQLSTTPSGSATAGQDFTDTAQLTGSFGTDGESITFDLYGPFASASDVTSSSCTAQNLVAGPTGTISAGAATSQAVTPPAAGVYQWVASYAGDADNKAVSGTCGTAGEQFTVGKVSPQLSTTPSASAAVGSSFTASATLSGGVEPSGTISFVLYPEGDTTCTGNSLGTTNASTNVDGNATYQAATSYKLTTPGTYEWTASYSGDGNNAVASSSCGTAAVIVTTASPTITVTPSPASSPLGSEFSATATLAGGYSPSGSITFDLYPVGDTTCTGTVFQSTAATTGVDGNATYQAASSYQLTTPGTYEWTASYSGDSDNAIVATTCGQGAVTVTVAAPSMSSTPSPSTGPFFSSFKDSVTISGGDDPGGTVTFLLYKDGDTTCSGSTLASSTATVTGDDSYLSSSVKLDAIGTYEWVASYSGDANNGPVSDSCGTEPVMVTTITPTITQSPDPQTAEAGSGFFDVADIAGGDDPMGTISFDLYGPDDPSCSSSPQTSSQPVDNNGDYDSSEYTLSAPGTYEWVVSYSGDSNNSAETSSCGTYPVDVEPVATSITSAANPSSATVGGSFGDTVTLSGGSDPTGAITFYLYGPNDTTCSQVPDTDTVNVAGAGNYPSQSFTLKQAGTYEWVASYGGDATNAASTTTCGDDPLTVNKVIPTISSTTPSADADAGSVFTDKAVLASGLNPTGTLDFSLYPATADCLGTPTGTATANVDGNGTYTSNPAITVTTPGYYDWQVSYSGDANNAALAASSCGSEIVAVLPNGCTINWVGPPTGGSWSTTANWNLNRVPGSSDVVCILPLVSGQVVFDGLSGTSNTSIEQLISQSTLEITGGDLTITDTAAKSSTDGFTLAGGTFGSSSNTSTTGLTDNGDFTWTSGTFSAPSNVTTEPVFTEVSGQTATINLPSLNGSSQVIYWQITTASPLSVSGGLYFQGSAGIDEDGTGSAVTLANGADIAPNGGVSGFFTVGSDASLTLQSSATATIDVPITFDSDSAVDITLASSQGALDLSNKVALADATLNLTVASGYTPQLNAVVLNDSAGFSSDFGSTPGYTASYTTTQVEVSPA